MGCSKLKIKIYREVSSAQTERVVGCSVVSITYTRNLWEGPICSQRKCSRISCGKYNIYMYIGSLDYSQQRGQPGLVQWV